MTQIPGISIVVETCARAAHEANRAYCIALDDTSQVAWEDAPDWQKTSARNGVIGVLVDGNGPRESHESWLREKRENGWSWGATKDPTNKKHPCFVPYDDLPEEQRLKDDIFTTTVRTIARALGWKFTKPCLDGMCTHGTCRCPCAGCRSA